MNQDEYLASRVNDQIDWYDKKSQHAQRWFKGLRGVEIIAAAAIPLIAGFAPDAFPANLTIAVLGATIAVIAALISLNQFQENWIKYRTTCESLRHEKFLFLTKADPYQDKEPFPLFVQRVESLISKENSDWSHYVQANLDRVREKLENR